MVVGGFDSPRATNYKPLNKHTMDIEKLTKALATYFREDEDLVRQIIVDNITLDDMNLSEPTPEQIEGWTFRFEDDLQEKSFEEDLEKFSKSQDYDRDLTDEELREEVERIRSDANWMNDPDMVEQVEGLARQVFDGLSFEEQTRTLLDMVLNLCDEIDNLKKQLNEQGGTDQD